KGRRFPCQVEPLTKELPDDGKGRQADEGFGMRRQSASAFKAPDVDWNGERLQLAASNRLSGGVLTNGKGIGGAGSSSGCERSLARRAPDGHVLSHDLADCHPAESK